MFSWFAALLRTLIARRRAESELDDELRFHVEMETQANLERGLSASEARRVALGDLGGVTQARESVRQVRALWFESVWQDARHACRGLWRRPALSAAAIAMLALAIGITTAMFTVVDALILRPVPFSQPDTLAYIMLRHGQRGSNAPAAVLRAWQQSSAFAHAESADSTTAGITAEGRVAERRISRVTPGVFDMLDDVRPLLGRLANESDIGRSVLLSEDVWRTLFHADREIVGRSVTIDGAPQVVIGVLPSEFRFPSWSTALWQVVSPEQRPASIPSRLVRFAPNVPRPDALRLATAAALTADPTLAGATLEARPLIDEFIDPYYQRAIPVLAGGVVLVFLVLCANVSSLLLARLTARQREFSMRSALGASRGRLIRQAFAESCVLGAFGTVAGIAIGWMLVALSRSFLPEAFPLRTLNTLSLDLRALGITSVSGMAATAAAGLIPAWIGTRGTPTTSLRVAELGSTQTCGARTLTRAMQVGEVALACTLLVAGILLVRSFVNLSRADRGFDTKGKVGVMVWLPSEGFPDPVSRALGTRRIEEEVRQLAGVQHVAWSYGLPPHGGFTFSGTWRSDAPGATELTMDVNAYVVSPEFFGLYGIPLLRGRLLEAADRGRPLVLVSERLSQLLWPGGDPIGRTFSVEGGGTMGTLQVVGLVKETHFPSLDTTLDLPQYYIPLGEGPTTPAMLNIGCSPMCPNADLVRKVILATHPAIRVRDVRVSVLEDLYLEQLARPRATAALALAFAVIALLAAAGGLFSVLSHSVQRRKREFGIRTALGASPGQVRQVVFRDGLVVAAAGVAIGSATAWLLARALTGLQYGVTIADPVTWSAVLSLLLLTTTAACWRPAWQATRSDLVAILREE
jgi:predicted permease